MTEINIESLAYGGDGVGHLSDGRAAFIRGTCPGDRVLAEITEDKGRFVRGRIREILSPSPDRVDPPCPYFGDCGGCVWQHVSESVQLAQKRSAVTEALRRIGGIEDADALTTASIAPGPQYGYRNKIEFLVDPSSTRPRLGFDRAHSEVHVPVDECLLLPKKARKAPKALGGALRYLAGEGDLGLHRVGVRCAAHGGDVEVALWASPGPFPRAAAAKMLCQAMSVTSLVRVLTKGPAQERRVSGVEVLSGRGNWREKLTGLTFAISAPSFFQVNTRGAEALVRLVIEALEPDGSDRVLDLYAGAGTFTLPLSELAGEVVAVESAGSAVRDLRRNLETNQTWAEVVGGDAAREIAGLGHFDLVVVDPPRAGLAGEVIAALTSNRPRAIAYVSCDPATLARDTKRLTEAGYRLTAATPVDLFPQSYHIETVARFERAESG